MVLKVKDYGGLGFLPRIPLSFFSAFKTASVASKQVMSTSVASLLLIYVRCDTLRCCSRSIYLFGCSSVLVLVDLLADPRANVVLQDADGVTSNVYTHDYITDYPHFSKNSLVHCSLVFKVNIDVKFLLLFLIQK